MSPALSAVCAAPVLRRDGQTCSRLSRFVLGNLFEATEELVQQLAQLALRHQSANNPLMNISASFISFLLFPSLYPLGQSGHLHTSL